MKTALLFLLWFGVSAGHAATPDLWPIAVKVQPVELEKQAAALTTTPLPAELKPAAQFQKTFLKILASKPSKAQPLEPGWVSELKTFIAADRENDPVVHGVAEVARTWFARAQMQQIDTALRLYYRKNIRFPDAFSAIEPSLPEPLRRDPWGQPWSYQPSAPEGFSKLAGQRYRLGPACLPNLSPLGDATGDRNPAAPAWKIALHHSGEARVLEFRSATGTLLLQPGGKTDGATLLYIGENWALLAWPDQLTAITF